MIDHSQIKNYCKLSFINREVFLRKAIGLGLLALLTIISVTLGFRAADGKNCSECPGNGICNEESDCKKYKLQDR
jgi:hypothetical protein